MIYLCFWALVQDLEEWEDDRIEGKIDDCVSLAKEYQLVHQEAKPITASVEYINSKSRKYFWIAPESCLLNEFMN